MTTYKLTVNLDATLAVQNENGSFHYFKPSIGAEITTDETDDLTVLAKKFEDLYADVIGPNFNSVVKEFLINSKNDEVEEKSDDQSDDEKKCICGGNCVCKPSETEEDTEDIAETLSEALPKEEWE